ncbi:hypothetical protein ACFLT1_01785 [Bacteroidota bacterium]
MSLSKNLKANGYDLIEGPVRNHKPLQLWLKQLNNEAELYYEAVDHAFKSQVELKEIVNSSLNVTASDKDEYGFNIGITLLEDILKSLGMGAFKLSSKVKTGTKVSISYDKSKNREVAIGELERYFSEADFLHPNPTLLRNANRNDILVITGVLFAKDLVVDIESDVNLGTDLVIELNALAEGNINFSIVNHRAVRMESVGRYYFPIAIKASRIRFQKGVFQGLTQVTDNADVF